MKKKIVILVLILVCFIVGVLLINRNTILVSKVTYNHPYKETLKICSNGKIYESKIIDELTMSGEPQEQFVETGLLSSEDVKMLKNIITEMRSEELKSDNFSESYGISIKLKGNDLYSCEYFSQEKVNELNNIIKKYE